MARQLVFSQAPSGVRMPSVAPPRPSESTPELTVLLYDELRRLAASYLDHERPGHTLQPTALVHEAFLRLSKLERNQWQSQLHFYVAAAGTIRRVLVDYARSRAAAKRRLPADAIPAIAQSASDVDLRLDYLSLDEALKKLSALDEQMCRVVELRYFGGLTIEEAAEALSLSPSTISEKWTFARTWLRRELGADCP